MNDDVNVVASEPGAEVKAAWRELAQTAGPGGEVGGLTFRARVASPADVSQLPRAFVSTSGDMRAVARDTTPPTRIDKGKVDIDATTLGDRTPALRMATPAPVDAPGHLEGFQVLSKIGEGGMGVVHEALQRSLGRRVALKRVLSGDEQALSRFVVEGRVVAWLEHPNVVPVHLMCRGDDGLPNLAMKLVRGRPWSDLIAEAAPAHRHVEVLIAVCNAIAFAHDNGVVHRDLKPGNVMVGEYGEFYVLDWGVAFAISDAAAEATGLRRPDLFEPPVGTPSYMAPEQAMGRGSQQGPATDIYQLGCCLHAALMGTPRHMGDTLEDVLRAASASDPIDYPDNVPRELAAIANRATARAPAERYETVAEMRQALAGWLRHRDAEVLIRDGERAMARSRQAEEARLSGLQADVQAEVQADVSAARQAFEAALRVWPRSQRAIDGLAAVTTRLARLALDSGDLARAETLAEEVQDEQLLEEVAAARQDAAREAAELARLRKEEEDRDWSVYALPQQRITVFAGLVSVAIAVLITLVVDDWTDPKQHGPTWLWFINVLLVPIFAESQMRHAPRIKGIQAMRNHVRFAPGPLVAGLLHLSFWMAGESLWFTSSYGAMITSLGLFAAASAWSLRILTPACIMLVGGFIGLHSGAWAQVVAGTSVLIACLGLMVLLRRGVRMEL